MSNRLNSTIELLESRIAPASLVVANPVPDIIVGAGKTATIDLGNLFDATGTAKSYRTHVEFKTNFDMDTTTAGIQAGVITIELFDEKAPLNVQNFLSYVTNLTAQGDFNNVLFSRLVPGFVLQTGGIDQAYPLQHIPTGAKVHTEYSFNDPEVQNVKYTLAAALGNTDSGAVDVNSGSSDFFVNLADNSSTLGSANGGFTVFGKIIGGLDVIDKIAARPTAGTIYASPDATSPTQGTPYQGNYDPDPDHNVNTPSPLPVGDQAIKIVTAKVLAPTNVTAAAVKKFEFEVYDHTTHLPTSLVTAKLVGDNLSLTYNKALNGIADVVVKATPIDGGVPVFDTFSVVVDPNLAVKVTGDTLQSYTAGSDTGVGKVLLTNNGGGAATGKYDVKFYLVDALQYQQTGELVGPLVGSLVNQPFNIAPNASLTLSANLKLPSSLNPDQTKLYEVVAIASPSPGSTTIELYNDDNLAVGGQHYVTNIFGKVQDPATQAVLRNDTSISYYDAFNKVVTATISGPGYGTFFLNSDGTVDLEMHETTALTSVTVSVSAGAHTLLRNVDVAEYASAVGAPIGTLNLAAVDLIGSFVATGGAKSITFGDVLNTGVTHDFLIGTSAAIGAMQSAVKLGTVYDLNFNSKLNLSSLTAVDWQDTGAKNTVYAPGLVNFSVAGDFESNLTVNVAQSGSSYLPTDAAQTIAMTTFKVGKVLSGSDVKIAANIGTVDLGAISNSHLFVGSTSRPTNVASFDQVRTVASLIVRGVAGQPFSFSNSDITAARFNSITLPQNGVDGTSGSGEFGIVADSIGAYTRGTVMLKNLTTGTYDPIGSSRYSVKLV